MKISIFSMKTIIIVFSYHYMLVIMTLLHTHPGLTNPNLLAMVLINDWGKYPTWYIFQQPSGDSTTNNYKVKFMYGHN